MGITHYVKTKSGEGYTDRNGNDKEGYITVGRLVETARGNKIIVLDCIPFAWFSAGKSVSLYLNAVDDKRGGGNVNEGASGADTQPRLPGPVPNDGSDEIPF